MSSSARKDSPTIVKDELLLHIDQIVFAIDFLGIPSRPNRLRKQDWLDFA